MKFCFPQNESLINKLTRAFGLIPTALGLTTLAGWMIDYPLLSSFGTDRIPMAPSTALLFILYGIGVFFLVCAPSKKIIFRLDLIICSISLLISFLLFSLSSLGIHPVFEHLGFNITGAIKEAPLGHMSPVTAFCFVLTGALIFLSLFASPERRWFPETAFFFSSFLVLISIVFLIAYLLGSPFLYGSAIIPPASSTSFSFLSMGIGLLLFAGSKIQSHSKQFDSASTKTTYILILIVVVFTTGLIISGLIYYGNYDSHHKAEIDNYLAATANLKVNQLVQWRNERLGDATVITANEGLAAQIKRFLQKPEDSDNRNRLLRYLTQFRSSYQYEAVYLIDMNGITRLSVPEINDSAHVHRDELIAVIKSGRASFLDFHRAKKDNSIHLLVLAPLYSEGSLDRPIGVMALRIDPKTFIYPMLESWPAPSRSAETLLIRRDGNDALFLSRLRFKADAALNLRIPLTETQVPAVMAALGREGIVEGIDYRGVPVIAALRSVPGSPWRMVARMDKSEIFQRLREQLILVCVLIGVLLLAAGAGVGLIWRRQILRHFVERYEAAEALQESEERYRSLYTTSLNAILLTTPDGGIISANEAACRMFGRSEDELRRIGRNGVIDLSDPRLEAALEERERTGKYIGELTFVREDGQKFPGEISSSVFQSQDGQLHTSMTIIDITERKRAQEALAEEAIRRRILIEQSRDGIVVIDEDGKVYEANSRFAAMLGYTPEEILTLHVCEWDAIWTREQILEMIRQIDETGQHFETRHRRKDGALIDVEISSNGAVCGEQKLIFCVCRDITERKRMEKRLQESNESLRALFNSSPLAIVSMDLNGNVTRWNPAAEKIFGWNKNEVLGRFMPTVPEDKKEEFRALRERVLAGERITDVEVIRRKRDGSPIDISISSAPLHDSRGQVTGIMSLFTDITQRKKMQRDLHNSITTLEALFKSSPLAIISMDPDGIVTRWNPAAERMFGWKESEILGQFLPFVSEEAKDESYALLNRVKQNGGFNNAEVNRRKKDGSPIDINVSGAALYDSKGQFTGSMSVITDITEQKKMQDELRFRLDFESLIAGISSSFIDLRPENLDRLINEALKQLGEFAGVDRSYVFSFSGDLKTFTNTYEWCAPGVEPQIGNIQNYPTETIPWFMERINVVDCIHITRVEDLPPEAGKEKELLELQDIKSLVLVPMFFGDSLTGFLGLDSTKEDKAWGADDIKVLKMIGEIFQTAIQHCQAEESRRLLETVIEQTAEYILITDREGTIQYVNSAFEKITGFKREEAIGQKPSILSSGSHDAPFYHDMWETIKKGQAWQGRIINKRKDGILYTEDATISPVYEATGRIVNYVAVKRDVTQELELESQLRQAQKMESIGLLAGGVAHDFNNILTTILGFASLILRNTGLPEKVLKRAGEIEKAARRGAEVTKQLLSFSRKQKPQLQTIDLSVKIPQMLGFLSRAIGPQIDIQYYSQPDIWMVEADETQIHQVLMNLCLNSRDAMSEGGRIGIDLSNCIIDEKYTSHHAFVDPGEYVLLSFTDNGAGMDQNTLERIFEPFFTTKPVGEGTGLGLPVVYGIMQNHNGFINVYSEKGEGTTFKLYFPRSLKTVEYKAEEQEQLRGGNETVLIVDDEASILKFASSLLEEYGYKCITCEKSKEALEIYSRNTAEISLAILDIIMPGMSGPELFEKMKMINPEVRVIMSSGFSKLNEKNLFDSGVLGFLSKPYEMRKLIRTVREILDRKT